MAKPSFVLTDRDMATVSAICAYRALTTDQVGSLLYCPPDTRMPASLSRCQRRLKLLTEEGYLRRLEQHGVFSQGKQPYVYVPTPKGIAFLSEQIGTNIGALPHPKTLFLPHLLAINDVRICFEKAVKVHDLTLSLWLDEPTLRSVMAETQRATTANSTHQASTPVPDGYCIVEAGKAKSGHFFWEVDLGSEQVSNTAKTKGTSWEKKVTNYLQYITSGRFGAQFSTNTLRILTVTTSANRLATMKTVTEKVGGAQLFWFTTFEKTQDPARFLATPLWEVAGFSGAYRLLGSDPAQADRVRESRTPSANRSEVI